ncbi:hypothetical protein GCM10027072_60250 [Streptomyces bullii]
MHDWGAPVAWHTALLRPDVVAGWELTAPWAGAVVTAPALYM